MPYPAMYKYTAELTHRHGVALRSMFSDQFSDDAIDAAHRRRAQARHAPVALVHIRTQGGAISRVPVEATAFAHRTQKYFISAIAVWFPDDDGVRSGTSVGGRHLGEDPAGGERRVRELPAERGPERIKEAYPEATMARLREVKREVRPGQRVLVQPEHPAGVGESTVDQLSVVE